MRFIDRDKTIAAIVDLYEGAVDDHWQEAGVLAEGLGWDIAEAIGDLPTQDWVRGQLNQVLTYPFDPDRGADGGPCPICDKFVARVLLDGHLELHRRKGETG